MKEVTIALSNHRLENIADAAALMEKYDAVLLEEPPEPSFVSMLQGETAIEQYVLLSETEYPEFTGAMCVILRKLHQEGKVILQVEPYLEMLFQIHDYFSNGGLPEKIDQGDGLYEVYDAERKATAALLSFYQIAAVESFEKIIIAVKRFARVDSRRFIIRDRLRANALLPLVQRYSKSYIEAGQIHYYLWQLLFRMVPEFVHIRPQFLLDKVVHSSGITRHLYSPGDILTLRYIFHPDKISPMEDLLCARALIYNKIVWKEEITSSIETYPHTIDEMKVIAAVNQLSMRECGDVFDAIRNCKTSEAREALMEYLNGKGYNDFGLRKIPF